ncbi:Sensor protein PhoQ [Candidatus Rhodobacter oscarellae]|uniref:Sensor protein PhoQ n=1 Tax=Candidatus Rhodobacter oscarellae TaxID=1675527 RepID=A0A0J9H3B3_9RHOB|nr:ABC transporter substrate-binding protein [Candidatus Rhodobacter lobularis]KMW60123.1 Sensor protein PhoQ [Candidatus Rhodobacter lobularis]
MRYLLALAIWVCGCAAQAQGWEDRRVFGSEDATDTLRIISSTDTLFFAPLIESFLQGAPTVSVEYLVTSTADIDRIFRAAPGDFDVVVSSAMDLQLKLANDGFARRLDQTGLPDWAQWRQSLFAFTSEPAAIVINRAAFDGVPVPGTRQELIRALRERPELFRGRVGTYDVRRSGLGYLFATQDARASDTFWRLMEVMGGLGARLYCCSGEMIDDLLTGEILVAYNVLGSYAAARAETEAALAIVLPSDFPTSMMRTAMVSGAAPQPELAAAFVAHLIREQSAGSGALPLPPLGSQGERSQRATIALEPALMTYLDALKRRAFLEEWENAVIQDP